MSVVDMLYDICWMSLLLLVAKIIRTKIKLIQKIYIPTALLAGFLGLLLGNQGLKLIPFSVEISNYSGILICVLFGTMFLGNKKNASFSHMLKSVGDTFLVNGASEIAQFGIFILIGVLLMPVLFNGINPAFGLMLPAGFVGGAWDCSSNWWCFSRKWMG